MTMTMTRRSTAIRIPMRTARPIPMRNEHTHSHEDCGHTHCDACGGCEHSPKEELMALMKYMVGHNASHANELANLAKQLQEMGETAAYDQIMLAVSDFEKGNLRLSTVLASMQAPNA